MVAVIRTGNSLRHTFHYNENKVKEGSAYCIHAENYPMDLADMTGAMRLNMLLKTAEKNPNVQRNSVHISLNFAPGEQFPQDVLKKIAQDYMERIGFGKQPYLVYEHLDAGHPHIHIATVKIRPDGSRIDTQNIGKNQSETARKELEEKYGLVRADDHKRYVFKLEPVPAGKVLYGRSETKRGMQNVLVNVLENYKYTSLPELNAVLGLYNITADRGSEDSRIYKNNGLVYRVLDEQGNKLGVPVKASDFYIKPTLKYLEKRFFHNDVERQKHKTAIRTAIDFAFHRNPEITLPELTQQLKSKGIRVVQRQNKEGLIYGITYIDHNTKCVFNGSALGKNYSAKAMQERCGMPVPVQQLNNATQSPEARSGKDNKDIKQKETAIKLPEPSVPGNKGESVLDVLATPEETYSYIPYELRKKKKKKKRISR